MIFKLCLVWSYLNAMMRRRFVSQSLEAWQNKKIIRHLRTIVPRSPYYRTQFAERPLTQWRDLQIMDKTKMMAVFDQLNTVGITKSEALACALQAEKSRDFSPVVRGVTVGLSSGTSGSHGIFLASKGEQARWAGVILAKVLPFPIFKKQSVGLFLRANSNLYESLNRGRIDFKFFDLQLDLEEHIGPLVAFAPQTIVAPPSVLKMLANYKNQGLLNLKTTRIVSCGEVLEKEDQEFITTAFSQQIHQIYQATEGFLGATCARGVLHLNEDYLLIEKEWLDDKRFIPIITDFSRTSQPMIRYRLNDILQIRTTPCSCGSVLTALEAIEGRSDDIFYLQDIATKKAKPIFPDFIRRTILLAAGEQISNYRVIQNSKRHWDIYLEISGQQADVDLECLRPSMQQAISDLSRHFDVQEPEFRLQHWRPSVGKQRRIEQRIL